MAGGGGFEPPLTESESAVLPLDDPPEANSLGQELGASDVLSTDVSLNKRIHCQV